MNLTCNSTLENMRITSESEVNIVGPLNFHELARLISASCTLISVVLSLYLIWMHALNYTQPREQRHIIRILFMVPVYSLANLFQIQWYWKAIYFQVISDCYEAFAIASFFALICHYVAPDLHTQKNYFRNLRPIKPWLLPVNQLAKCCGGERGMWRTPKSGLTWFNIIWIGVYQYCFCRVAMTITAVVTQHYNLYCESSNSPVFAHIWVLVIESVAVTFAMYFLIQFYVQLSQPLAEHKLFIKILAIKLVIFLSFWQATAISIGVGTLKLVHPNKYLAYPDISVTIPAMLLCVEMTAFAILHLWAFPYAPYRRGSAPSFYPNADPSKGTVGIEKLPQAPGGGFMGLGALWDAMNLWDFVKAFGRGIRWLFCGVKKRKEDISYKLNGDEGMNMDNLHEGKPGQVSYNAVNDASVAAYHGASGPGEESVGLIYNAQSNPEIGVLGSSPPNITSDPTITAYHGAGGGMSTSHGDEGLGLIYNGQSHSQQQQQSYQHSYQPQSYQQHPYQQQPTSYSQDQPYDPPSYGGQGQSSSSYTPYDRIAPPQPSRPADSYDQGSWRPNY